MKKVILSNGREYKYKPIPLYLGRKKINISIAKKNLSDFYQILKSNNIKFLLFYGTLLGAIRENGFISHDEDIDVILSINEFQDFKDLLYLLRENGFELARLDERGFASIIRNNEYIDLYFFSEYNEDFLSCCGEFVEKNVFDNPRTYNLYGVDYPIPQEYEHVLRLYYGRDWNIPKEYTQHYIKQLISIFNQKIKSILPRSIVRLYYNNKERKLYSKFIIKYHINLKDD